MQTRPTRLSTKIALWIFGVMMLAFFVLPGELINYQKYRARASMCKSDLMQISVALQSYQKTHVGKMPPTLKAIQFSPKTQVPFICPLSGTETTPTYHYVTYQYRFLIHPQGTDAVCWDSHPHQPWQAIFVWLNRPNRNVLLADGQVENMQEDDFQRLHLQGQNWIIR